MTPLVAVVATIGMIFVVPLGLRLIPPVTGSPGGGAAGPTATRRLATGWPYAAVPAAVALWLPRGALAAAGCVPYVIVAGWLAVAAAHRMIRQRGRTATEIAIVTAMVSPAIAAAALVAERAGVALFGFPLPILALTVAHFHFAGFAAALVAGLVSTPRAEPRPTAGPEPTSTPRSQSGTTHRVSRPNWYAAVSVPAGIGLVFIGFFLGTELQLAGAVVLTSGMWVVAWSLWRDSAPGRGTRWLGRTAALVLPATMLLALDWALGHVFDLPHLSLRWMEATHGVCNAIGFALCAVLALRLSTDPREPAADHPATRAVATGS